MAVKKQEIELLSGMMVGLKVALVLLVKALHAHGALDGDAYAKLLKEQFNDPAAQFDRPAYQFLQGIAQTLDAELAEMPEFRSGDF